MGLAKKRNDTQYYCKNSLFFNLLRPVLNESVYVMVKVRIAGLLKPSAGMTRSNWQKAFDSISSKYVDFAICEQSSLQPLCAIELNDKSHQHKSKKGRNKFIAEAFGSAHMPLHFMAARRTYNVERLRTLLGLYVIPGKVSPLPVIEKA
jgi:hypothetical protein